MAAPKQIGVFERRHEFIGAVLAQCDGRVSGCLLVSHAIDSPVGVVAEVGFVGISHAHFEAVGLGIVLNNKAVPVGYPHRAVGAHFGKNGRKPLVSPRHEVEGFLVFVVSTFFYH